MSKLAFLFSFKSAGVLTAAGLAVGMGITALPGFLSDKAECPEMFLNRGLAKNWPDACGTGRPPYGALEDLSGIWDIEAPGNPYVEELMVGLAREHDRIGWREKDAAYVESARSIEKAKGGAHYKETGMSITVAADGTVTGRYGQYEYCSCVPIKFVVKPTADVNVMRGVWTYQDTSGATTWRRRPPPEIRSVYFRNKTSDPGQDFIRDKVAFDTRPLLVERNHPVTCGYGLMLGNCDGIWLTIEGQGFAGSQQVWVDPASFLEIIVADWYCSDGSHFGYDSDWYRCGSNRTSGDGVAGLRLHLAMWDGMTPGIKTVWVNGEPVKLKMIMHNYPGDEEVENPEDPDIIEFEHAEGAAGNWAL